MPTPSSLQPTGGETITASVVLRRELLNQIHISANQLQSAWEKTDAFLAEIPIHFQLSPIHFYSILNQRNLSGFVGEIFANALASEVEHLESNPHADGRPDLLDLGDQAAAQYFKEACFDAAGQPIRSALAPFPHRGLEVKATIGSSFSRKASEMPIGFERRPFTNRLTYWAHHRHKCTLLGIYYDFFAEADRSPQLCAIFHAAIDSDDWQEVSVGKKGSKKTSNTSLTKTGVVKLMDGLVAHRSDALVVSALERFGVGTFTSR